MRTHVVPGMGVVADVIVFHPYDGGHWGFDCMGGRDPQTYNTTHDKFYIKYVRVISICSRFETFVFKGKKHHL
jgi:hypothetical protein